MYYLKNIFERLTKNGMTEDSLTRKEFSFFLPLLLVKRRIRVCTLNGKNDDDDDGPAAAADDPRHVQPSPIPYS